MQRLCISRGHAFLLVYSICSRATLDELADIYNELAKIKAGELPQVPIMLVGNKNDDAEKREVSTAFAQALADRWKCGFTETSAKTNINVKEMFQELLQMETRRNMTLVVDNHVQSRFVAFFRRRPRVNEDLSSNSAASKRKDLRTQKSAEAKQQHHASAKGQTNQKGKDQIDKDSEKPKVDTNNNATEGASEKKCSIM